MVLYLKAFVNVRCQKILEVIQKHPKLKLDAFKFVMVNIGVDSFLETTPCQLTQLHFWLKTHLCPQPTLQPFWQSRATEHHQKHLQSSAVLAAVLCSCVSDVEFFMIKPIF